MSVKRSGRIDYRKVTVITSGCHGLFCLSMFLNWCTVSYLCNKRQAGEWFVPIVLRLTLAGTRYAIGEARLCGGVTQVSLSHGAVESLPHGYPRAQAESVI